MDSPLTVFKIPTALASLQFVLLLFPSFLELTVTDNALDSEHGRYSKFLSWGRGYIVGDVSPKPSWAASRKALWEHKAWCLTCGSQVIRRFQDLGQFLLLFFPPYSLE
jgi:hypothetical protein